MTYICGKQQSYDEYLFNTFIWFLLSWSRISTTVWLHHLNSNIIPGEKAIWEVHKDEMHLFMTPTTKNPESSTLWKSNLIAIYMSSYMQVKQKRYSGHCRRYNTYTTLSYGITIVGQPENTYVHELCAYSGCRQKN